MKIERPIDLHPYDSSADLWCLISVTLLCSSGIIFDILCALSQPLDVLGILYPDGLLQLDYISIQENTDRVPKEVMEKGKLYFYPLSIFEMGLTHDLKRFVLHGVPNIEKKASWHRSLSPWTCPPDNPLTPTQLRSSKVPVAGRAAWCQRRPSGFLLSHSTWDPPPPMVRIPLIWHQQCCITDHFYPDSMVYPPEDKNVAAYFTSQTIRKRSSDPILNLEIHYYSFFISLFRRLASEVRRLKTGSHQMLAAQWWEWLIAEGKGGTNRVQFYSDVVSEAWRISVHKTLFYEFSSSFVPDCPFLY